MTLMQRRRALMGADTEKYPKHEIGYNLLMDTTEFANINIGDPTSERERRWASTASFIKINPAYTYKVGKENTKYSVFCYDRSKRYIGRVQTDFKGGAVTLLDATVYVNIAWGYTDETIEQFRESIAAAGYYGQTTGTFFARAR